MIFLVVYTPCLSNFPCTTWSSLVVCFMLLSSRHYFSFYHLLRLLLVEKSGKQHHMVFFCFNFPSILSIFGRPNNTFCYKQRQSQTFKSMRAYINFFFFVRWLRSSNIAVLGQEFVHQSLMELKI